MSRNYDSWERLVAAVLKRELLLKLFHADSRTPSDLSEASDISSKIEDVSFGYSISVNKPKKNPGLVFLSDYDQPISDIEDLLKASSLKILGRGTFTSARAYMFSSRRVVVVKRLIEMDNILEEDFKKHMRMIGDVDHENVARLKAYFCPKGKKFMICDYCYGGSIFTLLHGKPGKKRAHVDWEARLKIAIGAARGISHIHTQNGGKMVHGNIKSSNVFLNSNGYGLISDLGLASMVPTTFPLSSRCYAPEVKSTRDISQASDVYSFGILWLELLTRRSHVNVDLAKFVSSINRHDWDTSAFDRDLWLTPKICSQIVRLLEIGARCVQKSPKKRPKMQDVAKMIEDISVYWINHDLIKSERDDSGKSGFNTTRLEQTIACNIHEVDSHFKGWFPVI